jgi:TonB family protein
MNEAHADSSAPGLGGLKPQPERRGEGRPAAPKLPGEGWSRQRGLTFVALIFAAEVAIIFALGEKQFPPPRAVANVPQLTLADSSSELNALDDPTLFALPHANDFASAVWGQMPVAPRPSFRSTEPPLPPPLAAENLGAVFARFMQTNQFAALPLDFKPEPKLSEPVLPPPPVFADASTLQIEGDLAQRKLLTPENLSSWPWADVIAPGKVQVLVDKAGNVVNAVLLEASGPEFADTNALALARRLRFAPAPRPTFGQLIFNWRTVPPPATNSPAVP